MSDTMNQGGNGAGQQGGQQQPAAFVPGFDASEDKKSFTWRRTPEDIRTIPADKIGGLLEKGYGFDSDRQQRKRQLDELSGKVGEYEGLFGNVYKKIAAMRDPKAREAALDRLNKALDENATPRGNANENPFAWLDTSADDGKPKPEYLTREQAQQMLYEERANLELTGQVRSALKDAEVPDDLAEVVELLGLRAANSDEERRGVSHHVRGTWDSVVKKVLDWDKGRQVRVAREKEFAAGNITRMGQPVLPKAPDALKTATPGSKEHKAAQNERAAQIIEAAKGRQARG